MHSLSGLTPTAACAHLSVLSLSDSKMIHYSFTLQGNRHTLYSYTRAHSVAADPSIQQILHVLCAVSPKLVFF